MIKHQFIQNLRKKYNLSQDYIARQLNISRPTYRLFEKGERELNLSEAEKLAGVFNMTLDDLIKGVERKITKKVVGEKKPASKRNLEIRVQRKNLDKFKEILLYVLKKVGAKPNVGESVICKLFYFIDFDYYEKFEENIIGATYIKNHYGPTPFEFTDIIKDMEKNGEIERLKSKYFQYDQKKYLPLREPDLTKFSAREINHINNVLGRLSDKSATELRDFSHSDVPWQVHEAGKKISYESVFYRGRDHSVRDYEDEL